MADTAHRLTDEKLEEMEKRLSAIYSRAEKEIQKTIDDYFEKFAERDAKQKARLEAGEITEQEYKQWRLAQMGRDKSEAQQRMFHMRAGMKAQNIRGFFGGINEH